MAHASISFEALILHRSFERRLLRRAENLSSFAGPFSVVGFDNKRTPSSLVVLYAPAIVITITVACVGLPPVDGEVLIGLKPPHAKIIQARFVDIGRYGTFVPNNPWGSVDPRRGTLGEKPLGQSRIQHKAKGRGKFHLVDV